MCRCAGRGTRQRVPCASRKVGHHVRRQEALTNIRRHTRPERLELILRYDTDGTRLTTRDHAERSSPVNATIQLGGGGYGLTGMPERAELLCGSLEAGHTPHGLRVELWIAA
jgi:signal transduction histidine kinase